MIRMPNWAPGLGRYHLAFAHHTGRHIRLAYAERLQGPWQIHPPGLLDVAAAGFAADDLATPAKTLSTDWAGAEEGFLYAHIASPDLHIDQAGRRILMYVHGLLPDGDQKTRLAVSTDGLAFTPQGPFLGPPYFRVFAHGGAVYALAWGGRLLRSDGWEGPFEPGPWITGAAPRAPDWAGLRHAALRVEGDRLHLIYSRIGDRPERLLYATVHLSGDWQAWHATEPIDLLTPTLAWEGADLPLSRSTIGAAHCRERALRDPCLFRDADGSDWLLYSGAGESGIGLARLRGLGE
ncbi:MAG: hypothetical protein AAF713_16535 [Pseudomonadota bacterium]